MQQAPLFAQRNFDEASPASSETGANRREFARLQPYWLKCNLGYVLDISMTGMKVLSRKRLKGVLEVKVWDERTGVVHWGRVVWSRRIRFRQHEVGIKFADMDEQLRQTLTYIASQFHD